MLPTKNYHICAYIAANSLVEGYGFLNYFFPNKLSPIIKYYIE